MDEKLTCNDHRTRRCPKLGHDINFSYCRSPGSELPCGKILDCWWETFDVEGFIREHFTDQQISQMLSPAKPKMQSLVELINRAKRAQVTSDMPAADQ